MRSLAVASLRLKRSAHTVEIAPDFLDVREDYRLIAVVDTNEENNQLTFGGGVFRTADGVLHVHGTDAADSVKIDVAKPANGSGSARDSITVEINNASLHYDATTVTEIHLRLHDRDDVLNVQPNITHHIHAFAGETFEGVVVGASSCRRCGEPLSGSDPEPLRHQVWEIPEIKPLVTEYQLHRLTCPGCATSTCGQLPAGVPQSQAGPRLVALVALLMGCFKQSKRRVALLSRRYVVPWRQFRNGPQAEVLDEHRRWRAKCVSPAHFLVRFTRSIN